LAIKGHPGLPPGQEEKEGAKGHFRAPLQSPAPLPRRFLPVDCCLIFFGAFRTQKRGRRQFIAARRRLPTKFRIRA